MVQIAQAIPNIRTIIAPILGKPYAEVDCWGLARHVFLEAFAVDIIADPVAAAQAVTEVWFRDDPRDPLTLVQPYDLLIIANAQHISQHVGLIVDDEWFIHTRQKTGVCLERIARLRPRILQLARLRILL